MLKMAWINDICVDVVNKIPIREDGRNKIDKTFKYKILNNGAYYLYHDWDDNHKVREMVVVPCPWYGHEECGFKLFMQNFIYKILPEKKRGVEVDFGVIWLTIQVGKEKLNLVQNPKEESRKKALSGFLRTFRASSGSFKQY